MLMTIIKTCAVLSLVHVFPHDFGHHFGSRAIARTLSPSAAVAAAAAAADATPPFQSRLSFLFRVFLEPFAY